MLFMSGCNDEPVDKWEAYHKVYGINSVASFAL